MTLKDIAALTGVSVSTVSRIISGKDAKCATEEVKTRVLEAVRKEGYIPNETARALKQNAAKPAAFGRIFTLFARSGTSSMDSYFSELAAGVEREVLAHGYAAGERFTYFDANKIDATTLNLTKSDALVVLGRAVPAAQSFISAFQSRVAYISLNPITVDCDYVTCDAKAATAIAMDCLVKYGHRRIAYVGEYADEVRYIAYKNYIIENKLDAKSELVFATPMTTEGGRHAAYQIGALTERPTAVFCANDVTALGVLKGFSDQHIKVPDDISVISIDNIHAAELSSPALTTVKVPLEELAYIAVLLLIGRMRGRHNSSVKTLVPPELVMRETVGKIK